MKRISKILILLLLILSACRETIIHDVSENDANRMLAGLHAAGFSVTKERQADGKWSLLVKNSESLQAIRFLDERRLLTTTPREPRAASSLLQDRDESRFRFERSLSGELEYTLSAIDGVLDVRVHLNLPERDPLLGRRLNAESDSSGSVLLIVQDTVKIDSDAIRHLVAGAGGIAPDKITVLVNQAEPGKPINLMTAQVMEPSLTQPVDTGEAESNILPINTNRSEKPIVQQFVAQVLHSIWLQLLVIAMLILLTVTWFRKRRISKVAQLLQS